VKARFDTVQVRLDLNRSGQSVLMGELHCQQIGAGEIFSFKYDGGWLARPEVFAFDPDFALSAGHQSPRGRSVELRHLSRFVAGPLGKGADAAPREFTCREGKAQTADTN
jgi:hypothetical protein